jgi:hypothetical protein
MITETVGIFTTPRSPPPWVIAHVVSNEGAWGQQGVYGALNSAYPMSGAMYRAWSNRTIGDVQYIQCGHDAVVANMCAMRGLPGPKNPVPLDYVGLCHCLVSVSYFAARTNSSVHMPMMTFRGGHGEAVMASIRGYVVDVVDVYLYTDGGVR